MRRYHGFGLLGAVTWLVLACSAADPGPEGPTGPDADGDSISDIDEGSAQNVDTDADGTPDYRDTDSDGDAVRDADEAGDADLATAPVDSDEDTVLDFRDTDSDDNGRPDGVDGTADTDGDKVLDFADKDDDGDSLFDAQELGDAESPFDTDSDGEPDFRDLDSDSDTISDLQEQLFDVDMDTIAAFRDLDSDGDCRPDSVEAGDADLATAPNDVDQDGGPDFIDLDSDGDGLLDEIEDKNCNGTQNPGESSTAIVDTDGDGVTDLVEHAAGTDPSDPLDNPQARGDFVFEVPYEDMPKPSKDTLDFATKIVQADVFFLMDTTGSMGDEIDNLQNSLSSVISQLAATIPNVGIGVGGYDDFPTGGFGDIGDQPFYLLHRIMTVTGNPGYASVQAKADALITHSGGDTPESSWEALFQVAKGTGVMVGNAMVPAFDPATAFPSVPSPGESTGVLGGVGFRAGSLPIAVIMTDAHGHNSESYPGDNYGIAGTATRASAITALNDIGVRVIGVVSADADYVDAKADLTEAVTATGALVPPSAWGTPGVDRPPSCPASQCCTGQSDTGEPPDTMGLCPLTFTVSAAGVGLGASIAKAIKVLTTFAPIDIRAAITDEPSDAIDAVEAFVDRIEANPNAPAPCTAGLMAIDGDNDGLLDTYPDIVPGPIVCFDVVPKMNTSVMPSTMPQVFKAVISVIGDDVATLDTRDVYFLVPPVIPTPPVK